MESITIVTWQTFSSRCCHDNPSDTGHLFTSVHTCTVLTWSWQSHTWEIKIYSLLSPQHFSFIRIGSSSSFSSFSLSFFFFFLYATATICCHPVRLIEAFALKDLGKVVRGPSLMKSDLIKWYSCQCERRRKKHGGTERRRGQREHQ